MAVCRLAWRSEHFWLYRAILPAADNFVRGLRNSMGKLTALIIGILVMTACGARPADSNPNAGFINNPHHSDAQLESLWKAARQTLSQQIDLNPL
jgi:hypothetical protein